MGLREFLEVATDQSASFSEDLLAELSGIPSDDAAELAETWEDWPAEHLSELLTCLIDLRVRDARVEFEAVFKAALHQPDARARTLAVDGLSGTDDRSVIGRLIEILKDDEAEAARTAAAVTLAGLCSLASDGKLHHRDGERLEAALTQVLSKESEAVGVRRRALEAIAVFAGAAVDRFVADAARSEDALMRQSALSAMGRTCSPRWLQHVLGEMESPEAATRREATLALGQISDVEHPDHRMHLNQLETMLDDMDLEVQIAAVTALRTIGGTAARRLLMEATHGPEPSVAKAAGEALETLDAEDSLGDDMTPDLAGSLVGMPMANLAPDDEAPDDEPLDIDDEDEYDWREREIVHPDDDSVHDPDDNIYLGDPGEWPRNNLTCPPGIGPPVM